MDPRAESFAERVAQRHGLEPDVESFPEGTKTAADAAAALGVEVAQIASSIVFAVDGGLPAAVREGTGDPPDRDPGLVVVVTSGANRVSEAKLAELLGVSEAAVRPADPPEVEATGYAVGGVPPLAHDEPVPTYVDRDLLEYETVWAAAGTPETVFPVDPGRLRALADAPVVDVVD